MIVSCFLLSGFWADLVGGWQGLLVNDIQVDDIKRIGRRIRAGQPQYYLLFSIDMLLYLYINPAQVQLGNKGCYETQQGYRGAIHQWRINRTAHAGECKVWWRGRGGGWRGGYWRKSGCQFIGFGCGKKRKFSIKGG